MVGDIVGYVLTKASLTTIRGAENPKDFENKTLRVWEFDQWGGALVLNPQGTAIATIDKEDIVQQFKCKVVTGVIVPPNYNDIQAMQYAQACLMRKGGYDNVVAQMVVIASLLKNEFCDSLLWHFEPKPVIFNI